MNAVVGIVVGIVVLGVIGLAVASILRGVGVLPGTQRNDSKSPRGHEMAQQAGYENLASAGSGLRTYGVALKGIGVAVILVGILGGVLSGSWHAGFGVGIGTFGLVMGLLLHAAGVFFAAFGEAFLALRDMALNTSRIVANTSVAKSPDTKPAGQQGNLDEYHQVDTSGPD